jgi:hypothetical protein
LPAADVCRRRLSRFSIAAIDAAYAPCRMPPALFLILIFFHFFADYYADVSFTPFRLRRFDIFFRCRFQPFRYSIFAIAASFSAAAITPASFSAAFAFSPSNTADAITPTFFRLLRHYAVIR